MAIHITSTAPGKVASKKHSRKRRTVDEEDTVPEVENSTAKSGQIASTASVVDDIESFKVNMGFADLPKKYTNPDVVTAAY